MLGLVLPNFVGDYDDPEWGHLSSSIVRWDEDIFNCSHGCCCLGTLQCTLEEPTEVTKESMKEKKQVKKDKVPFKEEKEMKEKVATLSLELCKLRRVFLELCSNCVRGTGRAAQRQKGKAGMS